VLAIDSDPRLAGACCWKLDVEGHEVEVLVGPPRPSAKRHPRRYFVKIAVMRCERFSGWLDSTAAPMTPSAARSRRNLHPLAATNSGCGISPGCSIVCERRHPSGCWDCRSEQCFRR
jgi:hypothetical protein